MEKQVLSLGCLVITSLDEPWICSQSSILACMVGRLGQEIGRFNLHKPSTTCLALCSAGMKECKHDLSSIRSYLSRVEET